MVAASELSRRVHRLRPGPGLRRTPLAWAAGLLLALPLGAQAAVSASGNWSNSGPPLAIGPGDTDWGDVALWVGLGAAGSLNADAGSLLRIGELSMAGNLTGTADALFTGAGTRLVLMGDGLSTGQLNRFDLGNWGRASFTLADGAVIDGRANASACLAGGFCHSFIGNAAGSDASFTLTGSGTQASFLQDFVVGGLAVFRPPVDGFTFGTPGGVTTGRVRVLSGATLTTDTLRAGVAPGGGSPTGTERSFAELTVDGANALWQVTGSTLGTAAAGVSTAQHRNAWTTLSIANGGEMRLEGTGNAFTTVNLTTGGGRTDASISGVGSRLSFAAQSGVLQVGQSLGTASLDVLAGGRVDNAFYVSVGRNGSSGTLSIDGAGSVVHVTGTATAAANGVSGAGVMDIGRNGGNGTVNVRNGGLLDIAASTGTTNGMSLSLGRDAASSGTLNISSGGLVKLSAQSSAPDTAAETWNPFVRIGRDGNGTLNISGGGVLRLEGGAVSTVANTRRTSLFIGGSGDATVGGKGVATVSGTGSAIQVTGADAYIGVGHGPQAVGNLSLFSGASASATILGVGNFGGTGVAVVDAATVQLAGQYTGQGQFGAALVVGAGEGAVGNLTLRNGAAVTISNAVGAGGGVSIGGSRSNSGGDGALTMNAASLSLDIPSNNGGMVVGRTGSGLLRLQNGSTVNLGANGLTVALASGSDGSVLASGGAVINAGWVGVGRSLNLSTGVHSDGGTATMVLNGATLNAQDVVIGTNGYLGGTAGAINVSGTLTNYGTFSPGNSPGVFSLNGNFVAGAGSRLVLEVLADGSGGFVTDELRFDAGSSLDLAQMAVEFRFLGDTDPLAFQASGGFDIDTFLMRQSATGVLSALDHSLLAGVRYSARADSVFITDFVFDADSGATFNVVAVPEPATWALWLGGLAGLAWLGRRRGQAPRG